jgi:hypothetical protein
MIAEEVYSGLGYSGYALVQGIPIPLLPGNATENENIIKSSGAYHYDPFWAVGEVPVKNRRSLSLTFSTFICKRTMPIVKLLSYDWRSSPDKMDNVSETQFSLYPAVGEGYDGFGYVDEITMSGAPDALVSLNITMTTWVWKEVQAPQSWRLPYGAGVIAPFTDVYKPIAGWQTIPSFSVISDQAIPMSWTLTLRNNWQYQSFLAGYTQPPNPALITAGDLDVIFTMSWLAVRNSRPLESGNLRLQIGGTPIGMSPSIAPLDVIYIDKLIRDPQRSFAGTAEPNGPIRWEASYYVQGSLPKSTN